MQYIKRIFACMFAAILLLGLALPASAADETGAIHILNTGWEDAIILESGGHYALIDAGEPGRGPYIVDYLQRLAGSKAVHLDFVVGTHSHVDHMGGFPYILEHPEITIGKAYTKRETGGIPDDPADRGHYANFVAGCEGRGFEMVLDGLDYLPLTLGDMKVTLLNGAPLAGRATNPESLCQLVEIGGRKALLAGDMVTKEKELGVSKAIGSAIDFLKVGHHGMGDSTGKNFAKALAPKAAVYTNGSSWETDSQDATLGAVKARKSYYYLEDVGTTQYTTTDNGGIKVVFGAEGMELHALKEFTQRGEPLICETREGITLRPMAEPVLSFFQRVSRNFTEFFRGIGSWLWGLFH